MEHIQLGLRHNRSQVAQQLLQVLLVGMWLCGGGVALFPLSGNAMEWAASAALSGLGMAMLYPNLSAAVADLAGSAWRASAIGIYRFWRDLGYAVGALGIGLTAQLSGNLESSFWFVAISMWLSGCLLAWFGHNDIRSQPR